MSLPGGRTAVLTFNVSSQGVDGIVLAQAPADVQEQVTAVERRLVIGGALAFGVALVAGRWPPSLARRLARLRAAADHLARIVRRSDRRPQARRSATSRAPWTRCGRVSTRSTAPVRVHRQRSHELRTPLTALGGYLELLTEGGLTEEERSEFLDTMGEQVQRLTKLATDLLDLSRLDAGGITIAHDEIELGGSQPIRCEMQAVAARRGSAVVAEAGARLGPRDEARVLPGPARARGQRRAPHAARHDRHAANGDTPWERASSSPMVRHSSRAARSPSALLPRPGRRPGARASGSRSRASWTSAWTAGCS